MARIPMVSRTIKSTVATVLTVNTADKTTAEVVVELPRVHEDDNKLIKKIMELGSLGENVKAVTVLKKVVKEQLYGMEESEFMQLAKPIVKEVN